MLNINDESKDATIDMALLSEIKIIIGKKPTYGYRRVTAILNAKRHKQRRNVFFRYPLFANCYSIANTVFFAINQPFL